MSTPAGAIDPNFPFPDPTFLYVHEVIIRRLSERGYDSDEEGWVAEPFPSPPTYTAKGYVTAPDPRTLLSPGLAVDAVVLMSRDTVISHSDELVVPEQKNVPRVLLGHYRITTVRPNPSHLRVLISRVVDPESNNQP